MDDAGAYFIRRIKTLNFRLLLATSLLMGLAQQNLAETFHFDFVEIGISSSIDGLDAKVIHDVFEQELSKREVLLNDRNDPTARGIRINFSDPTDPRLLLFKLERAVWSDSSINDTYEGYEIISQTEGEFPTIWIVASRLRAHLFGLGYLIEHLSPGSFSKHLIKFSNGMRAPTLPLRGHQLGYRNTANSWDAWSVDQYDQYIRELVLLGCNAIEDIPFQEVDQSVHMIIPHWQMHAEVSRICAKYDIDYWVWTPAPGDLSKREVVEKGLDLYEKLLRSIPHLTAIFFPGGDPGDNHPRYIFPFLKQLDELTSDFDRHIDIWISLQGFDTSEVTYFFEVLQTQRPDWFSGLVHGPSSPDIQIERNNLPLQYKLRVYGDITHTIRCQYPVDQWDQAFALTLGREPINPEPQRYYEIFKKVMPFSDGFISYSDGVHDDVNKVIWNKLGWDPSMDLREMLEDYARFFFKGVPADQVADGILALERNWQGPLKSNGSVEPTLVWWQELTRVNPQLRSNWRWLQLVFRANFDAFVRRRLIYEVQVEEEAIQILSEAPKIGVDEAVIQARACLSKSDSIAQSSDLADTIRLFASYLFNKIKLQTSVPEYQARGYERGAVLDFMDYPLNNRWWLTDQFDRIDTLKGEAFKLHALGKIVRWDDPGPKGFYDNISRVGESPHVLSRTDDAIDFAWWENGMSRARLSSQTFQFAPVLFYKLDAKTKYFIRVAGYGDALLRANGERLRPDKYDQSLGGFKEFSLPPRLISDGQLTITFDRPDEQHLNWRQYSKVSDVWIIPEVDRDWVNF